MACLREVNSGLRLRVHFDGLGVFGPVKRLTRRAVFTEPVPGEHGRALRRLGPRQPGALELPRTHTAKCVVLRFSPRAR